ncbi:MAG TPA: Fur family transcriptional regulator [Acidimicrobiia bacterium]|jgi:Fur family ferric uptake transcriptional regulator
MRRELDELVGNRLAEHSIRYTRGRRRLVGNLELANGPQSAAEIHRQMRRSVPISSLYRSLSVLEEAGILTLHRGSGKVAKYELSEWLTGHHHHILCVECGRVDDIELTKESERLLDSIAADAGGKAGFRESRHRLEIEGLCRECQ